MNKNRDYDIIKNRGNYQRQSQNRYQNYYRDQENYNPKFQKIHIDEKYENQNIKQSEDDFFQKYENVSNESFESYEDIDSRKKTTTNRLTINIFTI